MPVSRGRFAPSPTGELHLGNARTALLAWLTARSEGGAFVLRVEDLDRGRVREHFVATHLLDLRWLGIDWDEGPDVGGPFAPYRQSQREELYDAALQSLLQADLAYGCSCSRREILLAASAPHEADEDGPAYPGTCRNRRRNPGESAVALRFRVPPGDVRFFDELQGERVYRPALEVGDFVVRRRDGIAAYQLAVVVDDSAMEITHVVRGADLLASTARQILLYDALDLAPPRWVHVPLMRESGGDRLAKREGSLTLRSLREREIPAEVIVGWLAYTCGLIPRLRETRPAELLATFDLSLLPREDTRVDVPGWLESG